MRWTTPLVPQESPGSARRRRGCGKILERFRTRQIELRSLGSVNSRRFRVPELVLALARRHLKRPAKPQEAWLLRTAAARFGRFLPLLFARRRGTERRLFFWSDFKASTVRAPLVRRRQPLRSLSVCPLPCTLIPRLRVFSIFQACSDSPCELRSKPCASAEKSSRRVFAGSNALARCASLSEASPPVRAQWQAELRLWQNPSES